MAQPKTDTPLETAIKRLGGQQATAKLLGKGQSTVSDYVTKGNAPADVCMRLELATDGAVKAEAIRPDLADVFLKFKAIAQERRCRRRRAA